jgi:hypothetical protein
MLQIVQKWQGQKNSVGKGIKIVFVFKSTRKELVKKTDISTKDLLGDNTFILIWITHWGLGICFEYIFLLEENSQRLLK